jgi:hypothetical protein
MAARLGKALYGLGWLIAAGIVGIGIWTALTWPGGAPGGFKAAIAVLALIPVVIGWGCRFVLKGE